MALEVHPKQRNGASSAFARSAAVVSHAGLSYPPLWEMAAGAAE